jgi:hypothetical protein
MKKLILALFCLGYSHLWAQNNKEEFDGHQWKAPYSLPTPDGWGVERFLIPPDFASSIPYKGVEDIRFAPGWGDAKSKEYWSYAFLWYLQEKPNLTAKDIERHLKAYYTGLIARNIQPRKIPASKVFPVKTSVREITSWPGDGKTFHGTIAMLDYMEQKPITLNCLVHVSSCGNQPNGFVFFEISPQPADSPVWTSLDLLWKNFTCTK